MILGSLRYLSKEGAKNIWLNKLMSLASVGVLSACLLMIGIAVLISINVTNALGWMEKQNVFMVFVADGTDKAGVEKVGNSIKSIDNVADCVFVSKDEALQSMSDLLGQNNEYLLSDFYGDNNFMPDAYKVTVSDLEKFDDTINQIQKIANVDTVKSRHEVTDKIIQIKDLINNIGLALFAILFIIALFIIANTIKLTMFVRRLEINIMKSVGATNGFIRVPFIVEGMIIGVISALFTFGVTWYIYRSIIISNIASLSFSVVEFSDVSALLLFGYIVFGILIGSFGGLISIRRYLKDQGGVYNVN